MTAAEQAAIAAAPYLELDPGFFLEQSALAGMIVFTDGKKLHYGMFDVEPHQRDVARSEFLWTLMKKSGGGKAVRELLIKRGLVGAPV